MDDFENNPGKLVMVEVNNNEIYYTENWKDLYQPGSANSALQAKSDSAPFEAIWAQFRPKQLNQKVISAHAGAHFSPWVQISPR